VDVDADGELEWGKCIKIMRYLHLWHLRHKTLFSTQKPPTD